MYPMEIETIGNHIRKRRLNLGLYQKDAVIHRSPNNHTPMHPPFPLTIPLTYAIFAAALMYNCFYNNPFRLRSGSHGYLAYYMR